MEKLLLAVSAGFLFCASAWAQDNGAAVSTAASGGEDEAPMTEAAWDWRPGDLIFRNKINDIDESIKRSFGLRWASVGILRASSGGPRVVYVERTDGVTEEMLYEHVEGLTTDEYAVYRMRDLDPDYDSNDLMWGGPMVRLGLSIAYGAPFDGNFMLGDGTFYNAEPPYASALNAGVVLGAPVQLHNLVEGPGDLDPEFRKLLEAHRYCEYELSFDDCWTHNLQDQAIVTTGSLISSGALDRVFP